MRNGQNKRMRGRNRKSQNPMTRVFESNGPDVKIRGTPSHIAEKYLQLARDAQTSGDPVAAENYYQHAEHYFRLIAAAQEQFRQSNPQFYRSENETRDMRDDGYDDGDESPQGMPGPRRGAVWSGRAAALSAARAATLPDPRAASLSGPRAAGLSGPRAASLCAASAATGRCGAEAAGDVDRLPSFITGGQQPPAQPAQNPQGFGSNGHENQGDRFPLHRRRRRHRGPRHEIQGAAPSGGGDGDDNSRGNE